MLRAMLLLASTVFVGQACADPVVIHGSTTLFRRIMEPYKAEIEANSKHELTLVPNKSLPGLIALQAITPRLQTAEVKRWRSAGLIHREAVVGG